MGAKPLEKEYDSYLDKSYPDIQKETDSYYTTSNAMDLKDSYSEGRNMLAVYPKENSFVQQPENYSWGFHAIHSPQTEVTKELYLTEDTVYSRVIEITEHFVVGSCLINENERKFQRRRYNKEVLSELNLKEGDIIEITVYTKPGEIKSTYKKNTTPEVLGKFERTRKDYFKGLENSLLFQPLASEE